MGDLRPGDYVDLSGSWTRSGYFEAYSLQNLQDGRNGQGYVTDGRDNRGYNN
jgi:hypothetical protein